MRTAAYPNVDTKIWSLVNLRGTEQTSTNSTTAIVVVTRLFVRSWCNAINNAVNRDTLERKPNSCVPQSTRYSRESLYKGKKISSGALTMEWYVWLLSVNMPPPDAYMVQLGWNPDPNAAKYSWPGWRDTFGG
jgi:hypothetical protein